MFRRPCKTDRIQIALIAAAAASVAVLALAQDSVPTSPSASQSASPSPTGSSSGTAQQSLRIREGTKLEDKVGKFVVTGDRITFYLDDGSESFRTLENLALERVARVLSESRERRLWVVNGTITEFQGANYLLVKRAMVKPRSRGDDSRR